MAGSNGRKHGKPGSYFAVHLRENASSFGLTKIRASHIVKELFWLLIRWTLRIKLAGVETDCDTLVHQVFFSCGHFAYAFLAYASNIGVELRCMKLG